MGMEVGTHSKGMYGIPSKGHCVVMLGITSITVQNIAFTTFKIQFQN
jgi:hypothetical protein